MSARDKVNEARYFLKLFEQAEKEAERRYLFSAFISAWRSVTFVLQKDYRSRFGEEFDNWYNPRASSLRRTEACETFLRLRTVSQKEGNKYPLLAFEARTVEGDIIKFEWDMSRGSNGLVRFSLEFANRPTFPVVSGEDPERQLEKQVPQVLKSMFPIIQSITEMKKEYCLDDNSTPIPQSRVVELCELNLSAVATLVGEAEIKFGVPAYGFPLNKPSNSDT